MPDYDVLKNKLQSVKKIFSNIGSTVFSAVIVLCGFVLLIKSIGILGIIPIIIFSSMLMVGFLYTAWKD